MKIKVVNLKDRRIEVIYKNVDSVNDNVLDSAVYRQLQMGEETATYPVSDWEFYKMDWKRMF